MNLCRRWRLLAWLCVVPWLLLCPELFAQVNGTITSTGCLSIATGAQATVTFQVTGSWSGTIQPEVSVQGQAAVNTQVAPSTSTTLQSTVTANGAYSASVAGYDTFLLCGNTVTGTAKVYINSTTARGGGNSGGGGGSGTVTSVDGSGQNGVETESGDTPGAITTSGVVRGTLVARTVSTNTSLLASDRGKAIQLGGFGGFTLTLPTSGAGFVSGYEVYLKQLSSSSPWTLSPATGTIDGQASIVFASTSSDRPATVLLRFDGTNWFSSFTAPQLWQNTGNLVFASSSTGAGSMLLRKLVTGDLPSTVANTALSNLASVAINTALLPGVDNSIALGSASFTWADYFGGLAHGTGLPISTGVSGLASGMATFLATPSSANLAATVSDETGTGALLFANNPTLPGNGAASTPGVSITGTPFTGGTGTTTFPLLYMNSGASAPTDWNTNGTLFGGNLPSGYTGDIFRFHVNGAASTASLTAAGQLSISDNFSSAKKITAGADFSFVVNGRAFMASPSSGVINLSNSSGTSLTRLDLGLNTSSGPAFSVINTTSIRQTLGDGSEGGAFGAYQYNLKSNVLLFSSVAPTISSGFGTGASVTANNGTAAFTINVGTSNTGTGVIGLPTATTGWYCTANDITTKGASQASTQQTASTTASATLQNYTSAMLTGAWVDSDVLQVACKAY